MTEQTSKVRTAFTKDDRGILNNWAIEPKMYFDDKIDKKDKKQVEGKGEEQGGTTEYAELLKGRLPLIGITLLVLAMIGITLVAIA
ncbi:hypothetical protein B9G53_07555 [Pseudanabaena sp. SR411]|uniref:hypothetical protein n=1 Tax=Pseudanabaena sp. SR411 TaxID=1980935 RepID=UPI000B98FC21|nr:hypothetical protein [Pseudanabaena sp. SR411]OYQ65429.1 hypothetical protein B9G53_07555 [Pseudanabaena sp. SR411]